MTFLDPLSHGLGIQHLPFSLKIPFVHVHMTALVCGVHGCAGVHILACTAGCTCRVNYMGCACAGVHVQACTVGVFAGCTA